MLNRYCRPLGVVTLAALAAFPLACGDEETSQLGPFCQDVRSSVDALGDSPTPEDLGAAWAEVDAEPPETVAEDWTLVIDNWDELSQPAPADPLAATADPGDEANGDGEGGAGSGIDLETAEAQAARAQELDVAWRGVTSYLRDVCQMELP